MNLIIDWSTVYHKILYSLISGKEPITRMTYPEEFKYRLARDVLQACLLLKPKLVVFAMDDTDDEGHRRYWRSDYMREWYAANHEVLIDDATGTRYMRFDNKTFQVFETNEVVELGKALAKKNIPADLRAFDVEAARKDVYIDACPTYKGNRKSEWHFSIPKDVMQKVAKDTLYNLTAIIPNSRIVKAAYAEADDIAGVCTALSPEAHTLLTVDGDWAQLVRGNVQLMNTLSQEIVEYDKASADRDLGIKIISGDAGDGIKSTWVDGKSVNIGTGKAIKVYDNNEQDTLYPPVLERNTNLIDLNIKYIPQVVVNNIKATLKKKVRNPNKVDMLEAFTITPTEFEAIKQEMTYKREARDEVADANVSVLDREMTCEQKFNTPPELTKYCPDDDLPF